MLQKPALVWILKLAHIGGPHEEAKTEAITTTTQHKEGTREHESCAPVLYLLCKEVLGLQGEHLHASHKP